MPWFFIICCCPCAPPPPSTEKKNNAVSMLQTYGPAARPAVQLDGTHHSLGLWSLHRFCGRLAMAKAAASRQQSLALGMAQHGCCIAAARLRQRQLPCCSHLIHLMRCHRNKCESVLGKHCPGPGAGGGGRLMNDFGAQHERRLVVRMIELYSPVLLPSRLRAQNSCSLSAARRCSAS